MPAPLQVIQVDASLYTAPYDAALTEGLRANAVHARWATRRPGPSEVPDLPREGLEDVFDGLSGGAKGGGAGAKLRSGLGYVAGWTRLLAAAGRLRPDVLHIQWPLLPMADAAAIRRARALAPVVITVHDLVPYNGAPASRLQLLGFGSALRAADALIVHTAAARETLTSRGFEAARLWVAPHGPLPRPPRAACTEPWDPRWTFVMFGKIQPYKGVDVLLEAAAALPPEARARCRFVIAGEALTPAGPIGLRISELGLSDIVELRPRRHSEAEMAALFDEADAFVFPYLQIEASGVFAMLRGSGKWMVASDLGTFREALGDGSAGALVPPRDARALAHALSDAIGRTPVPGATATGPDWTEIGRLTRAVYEAVLAERSLRGRAA